MTSGSDNDNSTTVHQNECIIRKYFEAVWNGGNLEIFNDDMVSDDYVMHHQSNVDYTIDELRAAWIDWRRAFPDLSNEIKDLIATDDRVVIRYRFSGTHQGPIMDVPANGNRVETSGIVIFSLEEGVIVEEWAMDDIFGLLQEIGECC